MSDSEFAMMASLVLDDGRRWAEKAAGFQLADARAIFAEGRPNWHFVTRPRGGSKTTDIAGVAIAWLVKKARPFDRGYVVASNVQQAGLLVDAAAGFVARTPELDGVITVEAERIVCSTGAWVRVLPLSDSGSWGLMNTHLLICDEFAQWPDTRGARRVWQAIRSTTQKTPGCRLVLLTSAGEPSHWSYVEVWKSAHREIDLAAQQGRDPFWRVSETPGPVPWQDPEELAQLRNEMPVSVFERLVLNIWSESEDRAISPDDYDAAAVECRPHGVAPAGIRGGGHRVAWPRSDVRYVVTVDIGTKKDATVICVAHREDHPHLDGASRVVVDHLDRWQGSKKHHVQHDRVRARIAELAHEYGDAPVYADPDQFVGTLQELNRMGVKAQEWPFTATSVGQVATALVQAFRNSQIVVPDTPTLRDELLKVRLRESAPGVTRLDHDKDQHDDQAVTVGLACHLLLGKQWTAADAFTAMMKRQIERRADRPAEHPEMARLRRRVEQTQGRPQRARERQQRACRHRWRPEGVCVYCGATREPA